MSLTLEEIGITQEEIQKRVVDELVSRLLMTQFMGYDDSDGVYEDATPTALKKVLDEKIKKHIDAKIDELANKHVLSKASEFIENLCLQETTNWGQKKGEPVSFVEYLIARAEHYLQEDVNYEGKTKKQDGYRWSKSQTRLSHLVHQHLHYSIANAMKEAIKSANETIVGGLEKTVVIKLEEIAKQLKVNVVTK